MDRSSSRGLQWTAPGSQLPIIMFQTAVRVRPTACLVFVLALDVFSSDEGINKRSLSFLHSVDCSSLHVILFNEITFLLVFTNI